MQALEVPNKLEATSFAQLRRMMLFNNSRLGGRVIYDIKPPAYKGAKWFAFYVERMDEKELIKEAINEPSAQRQG